MQFIKTKTYQNLARSFAGESQAGMRYQMIAKLAMQENLKVLSDTVKHIAKNETLHARQFFEKMIEKGGSRENVVLDAGYPFHAGTLAESLAFAAKDEQTEMDEIYPTFSKIAEEEGFSDIAELYTMIADVEKQHKIVFDYLKNAVKDGTLYKAESPVLWTCSECGHTHVSTQAWKVCPLCKSGQGYVELHLPFQGTRQ